MKLVDVPKAVREEARGGPGEGESRTDWQNRLISIHMEMLDRGRLYRDAARQWLEKVVRDATADAVKRPGLMPRAAAGQIVVWPELEPVVGRDALRAYARKYSNVVNRHALITRLLGCLYVEFGSDDAQLSRFDSLLSALVSAGATAEDIASLRELAKTA